MLKPFGPWVRDLREALLRAGNPAFSLRRFAEACDLSPTFISRLERGEFEPPSGEKLQTMLGLLKVDRWEFFRRAGRPDPFLTNMVAAPPRWMADLLWAVQTQGWNAAEADVARAAVAEARRAASKGGPGPRKAGGRG